MIIYAVNVHTGGGKVLLDEVLTERPFGPISAAFLDERYKPAGNLKKVVFQFKKSVLARLYAELKLHMYLKNHPEETLLFFGNLPPFFKTQNQSILYLQNCYLTGQVPLPTDSWKTNLRCRIERIIVLLFYKNVDLIWVQNTWMKSISEKAFPKVQINQKAFLPLMPDYEVSNRKSIDLLYVGSFSKHKRLEFFLQALSLLDAKINKRLVVSIVLDSPASLMNFSFKNITLELHYKIDRNSIFELYKKSQIFVSTSLYESFYLPLYEAHHFNCLIVAPDAGYTRELNFSFTKYETHSLEDLNRKLLQSLNLKL